MELTLTQGKYIRLEEYEYDRHENKRLKKSTEGLVQEVIPPNQPLNRLDLERLYGQDLTDEEYLVLSTSSGYRLVLTEEVDLFSKHVTKVIEVFPTFIDMGTQRITVEEVGYQPQIPIF